jgi:hypothetical protein
VQQSRQAFKLFLQDDAARYELAKDIRGAITGVLPMVQNSSVEYGS